MAKYLDHHKAVALPREAVDKLVSDIRIGKLDKFGVRDINVMIGKNEMWCLTEAPNARAVEAAHQGIGLNLGRGDVVEVSTLV